MSRCCNLSRLSLRRIVLLTMTLRMGTVFCLGIIFHCGFFRLAVVANDAGISFFDPNYDLSSTSSLSEVMRTVSNLSRYDPREIPPPLLSDLPVTARVSINVLFFSNIDTFNMDYFLEFFIYIDWVDVRLQLPALLRSINSSGEEVDRQYIVFKNDHKVSKRFWRPDIYFINAKKSLRHNITTDQMSIFLFPDSGRVVYTERITVKPTCFMYLEYYPFDTQMCPLKLGLYAYPIDVVQLTWWNSTTRHPVHMYKIIEHLPQFEYYGYTTSGEHKQYVVNGTNATTYSELQVSFHLHRRLFNHLLQSYIPTCLIVTVSWVGFWLDSRSVPGRITLGVTTLLAITSLMCSIRTDLPPVTYIKAIDVWVGACVMFVFGTIIEFTLVAHSTKSFDDDMEEEDINTQPRKGRRTSLKVGEDDHWQGIVDGKQPMTDKGLKDENRIDKLARILFPGLFFFFVVCYWSVYGPKVAFKEVPGLQLHDTLH